MKNIIYVLLGSFCFSFISCQSSKASFKKKDLELLYGVWNVEQIATGSQVATGTMMGNPTYEFTKAGHRVKSYKVPPHSDSIAYVVEKGEISYPNNPKIPSVVIKKVTKDSLILENDKVVWRLYK